MSNTLKFGNGQWATKDGSVLAYNDENDNFKPLPFNFERASSATLVNKDGLIEQVGSGEPRIDYADSAEGAMLLEGQSTNLVEYSEDFSNSYWQKLSNATVSSQKVTSPDGTLNASQIVFDGTPSGRIENGLAGLTQGADYTVSVYARVSSGTQVVNFGSVSDFEYTLTTEWQRLTSTQSENDTVGYPRLKCNDATTIEVWGFQLEQQSYPTSYIPTNGSVATRLADECNQTNPDGIIGQTEGTVFLDSKMALQSISNYPLFSINNGGNSDRIRILSATGYRLRFIYQLGGGSLAYSFYNPTDYSDLTSLKIAFTYKSGDIKVYINGVLVDSSTNTFTISQKLTDIDIATSDGGYNQMFFNDGRVYDTALTDSELQQLTS